MITMLQSIYSNVKSKVRCNGHVTGEFLCQSEVKQGCTPSPFLFGLFINELALKLKLECKNGIFVDQSIEDIFSLLFTDDLSLVADSIGNLQDRLNLLENYYKQWNVSVNLERSNIVVFKYGGVLSKKKKKSGVLWGQKLKLCLTINI
ncbi:hypothetical protein SNE40_015729 [Patella caerulea]|uniref:Reverse transcriptase domain-containing protein n=1 Tax=Patella caerulea TaxID=87958 RepID=A0AAN8PJQ9_PATCE